MGVHLYCIVPPGQQPAPGLAGVGGAPVHVIDAGELAVWASTHERAPRAGVDAARDHHRVVHAAMDRQVTPVPARFGQWFADADAAADRVRAEHDRWRTLLDRFAGHAEYGIRVEPHEAPAREMHVRPTESGTAYMAQLARQAAAATHALKEADRLAGQMQERAGAVVADSRVTQAEGGAASIAHLVAWDDIAAYHPLLRSAREAETSLRLVFTGPWPPYSFVQ